MIERYTNLIGAIQAHENACDGNISFIHRRNIFDDSF